MTDMHNPAALDRTTWLLASLVIAFGASTAHADTSASNQKTKRTSVDFTDQLIEGQAQKPELFYLLQQKNENNRRLIRLRENFLPEMRRTSEDVGRSRGRQSGAAE